MELSTAYCKVFPPIGIARLGNSENEFFIGPESPGVVPDNGGSYKDSAGAVKRQAARFRAYAFDGHGGVEELTANHPQVESITWKVRLANKKAEWFEFDGTERVAKILANDIDPSIRRRNANVPESERSGLIIGPVETSVSGRNAKSSALKGEFKVPDQPAAAVYLGELRTDDHGRLLVLGGRGLSGSVTPDSPLANYANNDNWHDDASDGPVTVEIRLKNGAALEVRGRAWVIVAPPHFSPHTPNIVTLHDVMAEAVAAHELLWNPVELGIPNDNRVSFQRDVYPILRRLTMYQWVSRRAQRGHAAGKPGDFLNPGQLARLADPEVAKRPDSLQKGIFKRIRRPLLAAPFDGSKPPFTIALNANSQDAINQANLAYMPPLAGDEGDVAHGVPTTWLSLTCTQYEKLASWKDGQFVNDLPDVRPEPTPIDDLPVEQQPAALTAAALEACQGGAFFPGIEITSVVRFKSFYSESFRVSDAYDAGDITKWMALPWQADFNECRDHWWPAIRPDDVVPVGDYEKILNEFTGESEQGRLASLLVVRKAWDRGVDVGRPPRPGLPDPVDGQSPAAYKDTCRLKLQSYVTSFLRALPRPQENQIPEAFRREIEEFLGRTILDAPEFEVPAPNLGEDLIGYRRRVAIDLRAFLSVKTNVPDPGAGETLSAFASRVGSYAAGQTAWQGLFDVAWRVRVRHWGKNELVTKWHRLGFVTPRTKFGQTVYVESDRGRFDLIPFREAFHYLMNIEHYPDFLPKAEELAREYVRLAREMEPLLRIDPNFEEYGFFKYSVETFQARLEKIYENQRRAALAYNPVTEEGEPLFRTPAQIVERIRQLAPFNQLDGSWLEKVTKSGPIEEVRSFLFEIWSDEIGNGDPTQNHANVYTDLMHSASVYLPPLSSRAYAEHPTLWDRSFESPTYQAAIAHFPDTFFPELLGMTLYLEWEANYLPAIVKLYEYHGYPSLFYKLHVAIDNPVNGHGALARAAVMQYLDHVRAESGDVEMQEHWRRIWDGYLAFRFIGGDDWLYRFTNPPTVEERMLAMFEQKRHYAQLNHGSRRFGVNSLNDWFDEPDQFLEVLRESDLITKGDAERSAIFALMSQNGPMLKVFTPADQRLWAEWINSLPQDPLGGALTPGQEMLVLILQLQARAIGVPQHDEYLLKGTFDDPERNGAEREVCKPVSWWFAIGQPLNLMKALANRENGWIIPGNVAASRFVTELLAGSNRMARFLSRTIPELDDKPARKVIVDWIAAECPIPTTRAVTEGAIGRVARPFPLSAVPDAEEFAAEVQRQTRGAVRLTPRQRQGLRGRRYGPGGGAPH